MNSTDELEQAALKASGPASPLLLAHFGRILVCPPPRSLLGTSIRNSAPHPLDPICYARSQILVDEGTTIVSYINLDFRRIACLSIFGKSIWLVASSKFIFYHIFTQCTSLISSNPPSVPLIDFHQWNHKRRLVMSFSMHIEWLTFR